MFKSKLSKLIKDKRRKLNSMRRNKYFNRIGRKNKKPRSPFVSTNGIRISRVGLQSNDRRALKDSEENFKKDSAKIIQTGGKKKSCFVSIKKEKKSEMFPKIKNPVENFEVEFFKLVEINKALENFNKTDLVSPKKIPKTGKITHLYYIMNFCFMVRVLFYQISLASLPLEPKIQLAILMICEIMYTSFNVYSFCKYRNFEFWVTASTRVLESMILFGMLCYFMVFLIDLEGKEPSEMDQDIIILLIFLGVGVEYGVVTLVSIYKACTLVYRKIRNCKERRKVQSKKPLKKKKKIEFEWEG